MKQLKHIFTSVLALLVLCLTACTDVELIDNRGRIVPAFNDVVLGKGNKGFYKFRKPLNAGGKWKLQVREILTGLARSVELP